MMLKLMSTEGNLATEFGDSILLALAVDPSVAFYDMTLGSSPELPGFSDSSYNGFFPAGSMTSSGDGNMPFGDLANMFSPDQWSASQPPTAQLLEGASGSAYSLYSDFALSNDVLTPVVGLPDSAETAGEGESEDIVITGRRPRDPNLDTGGGGDTGTATGGGGSGDGGSGGGEIGNDCRDRNALQAAGEIKAEPDDSDKEHGSVVYKGADGVVRHSPPIQGLVREVPLAAIEKWMADNGVTHGQVVGFVHNHPTYAYGGTNQSVSINSYPSQNDWRFADHMVGKGAGGPGGGGLALYIINPDKELREFQYSNSSVYKNLTEPQKTNEVRLPGQLTNDGTSC